MSHGRNVTGIVPHLQLLQKTRKPLPNMCLERTAIARRVPASNLNWAGEADPPSRMAAHREGSEPLSQPCREIVDPPCFVWSSRDFAGPGHPEVARSHAAGAPAPVVLNVGGAAESICYVHTAMDPRPT